MLLIIELLIINGFLPSNQITKNTAAIGNFIAF